MRLLMIAALAIAAAGCARTPAAAPPAIAEPSTLVRLSEGEAVGFISEDGARAWRGLPFAAPPVGELRWRAPRPPSAYEGVREALQSAPRCAQMSNWLNAGEGIKPGLFLGAEDCLYLDVYAPAEPLAEQLPVMVWIHGGANVWGRGSAYDGSRLANNENVVVVILQYRLGPLGYLAHPAIRDAAETADDRTANFATLDLVAALKWMRANAAAFGGDPERITIFGESAGGHNVATLLASPLAKGTFHRAIIQSGGFDSVSLAAAETKGGAVNNSADVAEALGARDAAGLRALPAETFLRAYWTGAYVEAPTVIEDGVALPAFPLREAFASTQTFSALPIIAGANRDEMKLFNFGRADLVGRRLFLFPAPRDPVYWEALNGYLSRLWRIRSVDAPAAAMAAAGHDAVYAYRFDWDESGKFFLSDFATLVGAAHAMEIPFVFNRFGFFGPRYDPIFFPRKTAASRETLSRAMGSYWAEFARSGAPGDGGTGVGWPKWSVDGGMLLRLDSENDGGVEVIAGADTLAAFIADLKADPRLDDAGRCRIAEESRAFMGEGGRADAAAIADALACGASGLRPEIAANR